MICSICSTPSLRPYSLSSVLTYLAKSSRTKDPRLLFRNFHTSPIRGCSARPRENESRSLGRHRSTIVYDRRSTVDVDQFRPALLSPHNALDIYRAAETFRAPPRSVSRLAPRARWTRVSLPPLSSRARARGYLSNIRAGSRNEARRYISLRLSFRDAIYVRTSMVHRVWNIYARPRCVGLLSSFGTWPTRRGQKGPQGNAAAGPIIAPAILLMVPRFASRGPGIRAHIPLRAFKPGPRKVRRVTESTMPLFSVPDVFTDLVVGPTRCGGCCGSLGASNQSTIRRAMLSRRPPVFTFARAAMFAVR